MGINCDAAFDPRAFHGLSKRLKLGGRQTFQTGSSSPGWEALIDSVNAYGSEKVLLTSKAGRRQISATCRTDVGSPLAGDTR